MAKGTIHHPTSSPVAGSSLRWIVDGLIEAVASEHEYRVGHDYTKYDKASYRCNTCFYLTMVSKETHSLPGDEDIICIRKVKNAKGDKI